MELRKVSVIENTTIEYMSPELLFLAKSGQPYRGTLYIHFISKGESVNLVDLKKYITSLRACTFTAENIAYEIFNKIHSAIDVDTLGVIVDLTARGGIQQRVHFGTFFEPVKKQNIFQVNQY
jgi:NADPH-dependent 7-cyano-7-deazaguanine reductase QueF